LSQVKRLEIVDSERCVGCQLCMYACERRFGDAGFARSAILVRSVGGVERGFTVIVCRACQDPPCAKVCPTGALTPRNGGGVTLNPSKCIGCGFCVESCPIGAVFWNYEANKPIICTYCGYCAEFCPHGVLRLGEVRGE